MNKIIISILCSFFMSLSLVLTAQNTISFTEAPNAITSGDVDVEVVITYATNENTNTVPIQVRLLNSSGGLIVEETKYPSSSSNSEDFFIDIPENLANGTYKWHTQMFNSNWTQQLSRTV